MKRQQPPAGRQVGPGVPLPRQGGELPTRQSTRHAMRSAPRTRRRSRLHLICYPLAVLLGIGAGAALRGGGDAPAPSATPVRAAATPAASPTPTSTAAPVRFGSPARDGDVVFTVTKVKDVGTRLGSPAARADGRFVLVSVTARNTGDEPQTLFGEVQRLVDGTGRPHPADTGAGLRLAESNALWGQLRPGRQVRGVIVFDLPAGARPASVRLHESMFSPGVAVSLRS